MTCNFKKIGGQLFLVYSDGFVQSIDEARSEILECVEALTEIKDAEIKARGILDELKAEDRDRQKVLTILKQCKHHWDAINKGVCDVQLAVISGSIAPTLKEFLNVN